MVLQRILIMCEVPFYAFIYASSMLLFVYMFANLCVYTNKFAYAKEMHANRYSKQHCLAKE